MLSRKLLILCLIALFTVIQCTVLNYLQIFKTKPDILLILVIFFSLYYGRSYGLGVGAVCGLFAEATCGIPTGFFVATYALGGLILGQFGKWVYNQKILGQILIVFTVTFIIYFLFFLFSHISNTELSLFNATVSIILPVCCYSAFVSPFIFLFLKCVLNC